MKTQAKTLTIHVDTIQANKDLVKSVKSALTKAGIEVRQVQVQRIETPKKS